MPGDVRAGAAGHDRRLAPPAELVGADRAARVRAAGCEGQEGAAGWVGAGFGGDGGGGGVEGGVGGWVGEGGGDFVVGLGEQVQGVLGVGLGGVGGGAAGLAGCGVASWTGEVCRGGATAAAGEGDGALKGAARVGTFDVVGLGYVVLAGEVIVIALEDRWVGVLHQAGFEQAVTALFGARDLVEVGCCLGLFADVLAQAAKANGELLVSVACSRLRRSWKLGLRCTL